MRAIRLSGLLLLLPLLTACQHQSPAVQVQAELKTASSWAATARMVGEKWSGGAVPTRYARRSLEAAADALEESENALNTLAQGVQVAGRDLRPEALAEIQKLKQVIAQMSAAIEKQDRAAMTAQISQLSAVEREIAALKREAGGQSS